MKITVNLTDAEAKGIKEYLKDVDGINNPTRIDVEKFIYGIIQTTIYASGESVSSYIKPS